MSTATHDTAPVGSAQHADHDHSLDGPEHVHPNDLKYVKIAIILAVITAAEVAVSYIEVFEENSTLLLLALMPMMVVKFAMVAWFFMHLKQDSRLFSRLFVSGLILAVIVYCIVLLAFDEFF